MAGVDANEKTTLDVLHLGPRVRSALERGGVKTLSDLTALRGDDLLRKKNIGRKRLREIVKALHQRGLYLRDEVPFTTKAHETPKTVRIEVPPGTKVVLVATRLRSKLTKGEKSKVKQAYPHFKPPPLYFGKDQVEVTFTDDDKHPSIGTGAGLVRG